MRLFRICTSIWVAFAAAIAGQQPTGEDATHVEPGVTPPRIIYKVEPEYSPQARADHIQGTVVLYIVVNEKGRPTNIHVISPLGYGLDEKAQEAIEKWQFQPGMRAGKPVAIQANIAVNFRFPDIWFDEKLEHRRTLFNQTLAELKLTNPTQKERAVKNLEDLAHEKFPPAMNLLGTWEIAGENVPQNAADGWDLIQKAADKNYGPALYQVGSRTMKNSQSSDAAEKGLKMVRDAATLGSVQAQFYLGQAYEKGVGVPVELDRARRYFRLCAAAGQPACQFNLARLLLDGSTQSEDEYVQAIAWLELAKDQGETDARQVWEREQSNLTPAQTAQVSTWKRQLLRK